MFAQKPLIRGSKTIVMRKCRSLANGAFSHDIEITISNPFTVSTRVDDSQWDRLVGK